MKERKYSSNIADAINAFLTHDDWFFTFDEKLGFFKFVLSLHGRIKKIDYLIAVKSNSYVVYATSPISVDPDDKDMSGRMAEFICRASFGLVNGNFEFDFRDGEIRYKTAVDCDGGATPTQEIIKNSIYCPAVMFDRYSQGLLDVIFGGSSAEDAIKKCENMCLEQLLDMLGKEDDESGDSASDIISCASDEADEDKVNMDIFGSESA